MLILLIYTISLTSPSSATITNRPTVYRADGSTGEPITIESGTTTSIDTSGMTITGGQIWLWLSTSGGSEINTALGDRPYAGPFLLSELVDTVTPHIYTFTPAVIADLCDLLSVDSPFAGEQRTYTFILRNGWINGTIPLKVQGSDVDYWIKITDVSPSDTIPSSDVAVSTNRIHFLPEFYATPLSGAPEITVTVSGYALPTTSEYNVTEDGTTRLALLIATSHDEGSWLWTGFSNAFNVEDLGTKVPFTTTPPQSTMVNITVWENDTAALIDTWNFNKYWREVYLEDEYNSLTFRGDAGNYAVTVTLNTGDTYDVEMEYFPAFGTASIYLGNSLVTSGVALNATGGARITITVPALTPGDHILCVKDNNAVMYNFTVQVALGSYIYCTPDSGYIGDSFSVTGVNFLDYVGQYLTIYFQNSDAYPEYTMLLNFTVSSSIWTTTALNVPNSVSGPRHVEVRSSNGIIPITYDVYTVIIPVEYDLTIGVSGSGTTSPSAGSHTYEEETEVEVTATASSGWSFDHWILDSVNVGSTNPYTITMNNAHTLTAVFTQNPPENYNLTIEVIGSGTTSLSVGVHSYEEGTGVTVTASAGSGYSFNHWNLDYVNIGSTNPYTLTMNDDHTLTAVFVENSLPESYDLTISVSGLGSTSPSVGTHSYYEGNSASITATPASEWSFDHWLLDESQSIDSNPFSIAIFSDHTLTAIFTPNTPNIPKTEYHDVIYDQTSYVIETYSNSTISDFTFNQPQGRIRFIAEGTDGTTGFCTITIPSELMSGTFSIYKDDVLLIENIDYTQTSNSTHYIFSLTYEHSNHIIEIFSTTVIPELTSLIMLSTLAITTVAVAIYGKKSPKKQKS